MTPVSVYFSKEEHGSYSEDLLMSAISDVLHLRQVLQTLKSAETVEARTKQSTF